MFKKHVVSGTVTTTALTTGVTGDPTVSNIPFRVGKVVFYGGWWDDNTTDKFGGTSVFFVNHAGTVTHSINGGNLAISIAVTQSDTASSIVFTIATQQANVGSDTVPYTIEIDSLYFNIT